MEIMTDKYKESFMKHKPTLLDSMINKLNQKVEFYEHPTRGDEYFVYALIDGTHLVQTDFFETVDMMEDHQEYTPFIQDGQVWSGFQLF